MTNYEDMLNDARFYGAKSEPIEAVDVIASRLVGHYEHEILQVTHGGKQDFYQVVLDNDGDVLTRPKAAGAYLRSLREARLGAVHGVLPYPVGARAHAVEGEQSNTSLVVEADPPVIVKVFRKLEPGVSPDVELLSRIGDCPHVAGVHGWVTREIGQDTYTLAMAQEYIAAGRDGWDLALSYARTGGSFTQEARLLGEATRAVHVALAAEFGIEEQAVEIRAGELARQLADLAARNPDVEKHADRAHDFYAALAGETTMVQRIHGDLHLGQVLRTTDRYLLIDFEGEPARPLADRRLPDSPLRDVAGVLRSLDYAARFHPETSDPETWAAEASEAFLAGYGIARTPLLEAYVLDKALYEVVYEADHRPDWVHLPLAAVGRLLG
ncbi:MAG TPA: phosphotransferase [Corynebacterium sp.]|nr:phosphotransferase [Corynebacterium sp.]